MDVPPVRPLDPGADPELAAALVALQQVSYRVEAELIGTDAIPALHDTPATLAAAGLCWLGCRDRDGLLAAAAFTETPELVDVERLVVAPRAMRRGLGRRLVAAVLDRAGARRVVVATGRANAPARALYRGAGFREAGEREVEPGLWITSYVREGTSPPTMSTASA